MISHLLAASQAVSYLPINWSQILIVLSSVIVALVALFGMIDKRMKDRQRDMEHKIDSSVSTLSTILIEKLETKENVAAIRTELARVNEKLLALQHQVDGHSSS